MLEKSHNTDNNLFCIQSGPYGTVFFQHLPVRVFMGGRRRHYLRLRRTGKCVLCVLFIVVLCLYAVPIKQHNTLQPYFI